MKRLLLILSITLLVSSTSCSSSDDDAIDDKHPLVGTWVYAFQDPSENHQYSVSYKFNENSTGEIDAFEIHNEEISQDVNIEFKWSADGYLLTFTFTSDDGQTDVQTVGYLISGNELTFSNDDDVFIRQ